MILRSPSSKTLNIQEIAEIVNGQVHGDASVEISGVCSLEDPKPGCISLYSGNSAKILSEIDPNTIKAIRES